MLSFFRHLLNRKKQTLSKMSSYDASFQSMLWREIGLNVTLFPHHFAAVRACAVARENFPELSMLCWTCRKASNHVFRIASQELSELTSKANWGLLLGDKIGLRKTVVGIAASALTNFFTLCK